MERVVGPLAVAGHEVIPVTLPGLAERSGEDLTAIDLDTHIEAIVDLVRERDLHEVVLVGHSGGGIAAAQGGGPDPGAAGEDRVRGQRAARGRHLAVRHAGPGRAAAAPRRGRRVGRRLGCRRPRGTRRRTRRTSRG
ncbi:alpha/beta fold hydrolase [Yinghuangia aomiensis]